MIDSIYTKRKMSKLNRDILYLIFEEFKDDKKALHSCLLVNRTWCEMIIPILWKDPWEFLKFGREKSLFNVIISHLSDESRNNNLRKILKNSYKRPLFDYISFCKTLDLYYIKKIIDTSMDYYDLRLLDDDVCLLYLEEIFKLFINHETKFTNLRIPIEFNYKIHLIPGARECFSEIEFLEFNFDIDEEVLIGLSEISKSIKNLEFHFYGNNYNGIIMLIDAQKNLKEVFLDYTYNTADGIINLEKSLIKHGKTIENIRIVYPPITNIFSYFENLKILKMDNIDHHESWDQLAAAFLPFLQILDATRIKTNILASLIEKTKGDLKEIKIYLTDHDDTNNKRLIRAIYQNCPNLKYLKLLIRNSNISEFEKLLINCKYVDGLYIDMENTDYERLFEILTRSSPTSLFKFIFYFSSVSPKPDTLKLFFDNWKGRHPMLLQTIPKVYSREHKYYAAIIEKYKAKGVIKKYDECYISYSFEHFEWIRY
jgi:hypothetical protein